MTDVAAANVAIAAWLGHAIYPQLQLFYEIERRSLAAILPPHQPSHVFECDGAFGWRPTETDSKRISSIIHV